MSKIQQAEKAYNDVMSPERKAQRTRLIHAAEYLISVVEEVTSEGRGSHAQKG